MNSSREPEVISGGKPRSLRRGYLPVGREVFVALPFGQLGAAPFSFSESAHLVYSSDTIRNPLSISSFTLPSSWAVSCLTLVSVEFRSSISWLFLYWKEDKIPHKIARVRARKWAEEGVTIDQETFVQPKGFLN